MILINNGKIFIDGKHITNPELIGFALLDFAENVADEIKIKNKTILITEEFFINDFFRKSENFNKDFRVTYERKVLIKLAYTFINNFNIKKFIQKGLELNISYGTCYNFVKYLIKIKYIHEKKKEYSFFLINQ